MDPDVAGDRGSRYHRQMLLPGIGRSGQARLGASHAVIVGCGALGSPMADLLVRAGVGTVTIVDRDVVELTNLQRQTLFDEDDARSAKPKAVAAAERLGRVNSQIRVRAVVSDVSWRNVERVLGLGGGGGGASVPPGVILDGTDNYPTRLLLNDVAVRHGVPMVYAGAVGTTGTTMTYLPGGVSASGGGVSEASACLRCVLEEPPAPGAAPTCDTAGVLGPLTAMIGAMAAGEAIRLLTGGGAANAGVLVEVDAWRGTHRAVRVPRRVASGDDPGCGACVRGELDFLAGRLGVDATVLCGRDSVQINPPLETVSSRLDLASIARRLEGLGEFEVGPFHLRGRFDPSAGVGEGDEDGEDDPRPRALGLTLFPDGRAIIHGTTNAGLARSVYARYVGA